MRSSVVSRNRTAPATRPSDLKEYPVDIVQHLGATKRLLNIGNLNAMMFLLLRAFFLILQAPLQHIFKNRVIIAISVNSAAAVKERRCCSPAPAIQSVTAAKVFRANRAGNHRHRAKLANRAGVVSTTP